MPGIYVNDGGADIERARQCPRAASLRQWSGRRAAAEVRRCCRYNRPRALTFRQRGQVLNKIVSNGAAANLDIPGPDAARLASMRLTPVNPSVAGTTVTLSLAMPPTTPGAWRADLATIPDEIRLHARAEIPSRPTKSLNGRLGSASALQRLDVDTLRDAAGRRGQHARALSAHGRRSPVSPEPGFPRRGRSGQHRPRRLGISIDIRQDDWRVQPSGA